MGWCSGSEVFDKVAEVVLKKRSPQAVIEALIKALDDQDWDTHNETKFWKDPTVRRAMKKVHPEFDWDEEEG